MPHPTELDFKPNRALLKFNPPLRQVNFTPWIPSNAAEETFIPTIGMIPGKIYQIKHQIRDGQKKLELKQKLNYQAEQMSSQFSVQPSFASEPKERPFYLICDNFNIQDSLVDKLKIGEQRKVGQTESVIMTAYGNTLLKYSNEYDLKDPFQIEAFQKEFKLRIIGCNG